MVKICGGLEILNMYFWKYLLEEFRDLTFFICYCLFVSECTGSSLLHGLFSSCGELGLPSRCSVRASLVAEHRLWGSQVPAVAAHGPSVVL